MTKEQRYQRNAEQFSEELEKVWAAFVDPKRLPEPPAEVVIPM